MSDSVTVADMIQFKFAVNGKVTSVRGGYRFECSEFSCEHPTIAGLGTMVCNKLRAHMVENWVSEVMGG